MGCIPNLDRLLVVFLRLMLPWSFPSAMFELLAGKSSALMIAELDGLYLVCSFFSALLRVSGLALELRSDRLLYYLVIDWGAVGYLSANELTNWMGWCLSEVLTRVDLFTFSLLRWSLSTKCDSWGWLMGSIYLPKYFYLLLWICRDISILSPTSKSVSFCNTGTLLSSLFIS